MKNGIAVLLQRRQHSRCFIFFVVGVGVGGVFVAAVFAWHAFFFPRSSCSVAEKTIRSQKVLVPRCPARQRKPLNRNLGALFTDPNLANAFMENALRPLIQRFGSHPAVAAWDVFNEPEWCVAETSEATTAQKVPLAAMRTFIGRASSIIHNEGAPGTLVTVGSASVKWSWERGETRPAWCSDFWGDAALVAANNGDPAAFLDFVQTHYYPWMKKEIDPFVNQPETYCGGGQGSSCGRSKPLIIGEAQANLLKTYSAAALLQNAREKGYAGLLYWSYKVRRTALLVLQKLVALICSFLVREKKKKKKKKRAQKIDLEILREKKSKTGGRRQGRVGRFRQMRRGRVRGLVCCSWRRRCRTQQGREVFYFHEERVKRGDFFLSVFFLLFSTHCPFLLFFTTLLLLLSAALHNHRASRFVLE